MDVYKVTINSRRASGATDIETFSIKSATREGAIIVALSKWLNDELRIDGEYILERGEIPQDEVQGYLEDLRFDDTTITIGASEQAVEMAEQICEGDAISFFYEEWEGEIEEISSVESLEELILEEVLKEVQKKYPDASITRGVIYIGGTICEATMFIKRGKLHIGLAPNHEVNLGELDLANPKFPTNVIPALLKLIESFVNNDQLLGRL